MIDFHRLKLRRNIAPAVHQRYGPARTNKDKLKREIRNLPRGIAEGGHSKFIVDEIAVGEREMGAITDRLLSSSADSIKGKITQIRNYIQQKV